MGLSYFNYRLVEKENPWRSKYYEIHEVYYDEKGEVVCWSKEGMSVVVEDLRDLKAEIKHIKEAGRKTVLKEVGKQLVDTGKKIRRKERW